MISITVALPPCSRRWDAEVFVTSKSDSTKLDNPFCVKMCLAEQFVKIKLDICTFDTFSNENRVLKAVTWDTDTPLAANSLADVTDIKFSVVDELYKKISSN